MSTNTWTIFIIVGKCLYVFERFLKESRGGHKRIHNSDLYVLATDFQYAKNPTKTILMFCKHVIFNGFAICLE